MSQVRSSSSRTNGNVCPQVAAIAGGWHEGILVLVMVLAPVGLAIILVAISALALAGWQTMRGVSVELPTRANLQLYGLLSYVVVSWIDVAAVWLWSSSRGLRGEVFTFRRPTWPALATTILCFMIAAYGAPIMAHWLSHVTGGRGPAAINFHDTQSVVLYALLFVATAPVCEEILYRGLLVAWLRRLGWRDSAIWLAGSLMFGANHTIPLGLVWAAVMALFGAMLFALRLRYGSLSPGWLAHFLFNTQPMIWTYLAVS